ncbi:peptidoglycan bridge formation glycyltransferase FemA/FemB family protein [Thioalkalivibrio sp. XN8]|uniref:lipid II:glycine glycyltransferase FemX n=1 Tax=Thioalkalivibrio sp. XN8 TaxID=2712863 RepID=UPI0013EA92AC|nr:peptidoglycan bridge formation glycyltransferase FemA/FemB family protein [Thioalkalivibrio sp. XN8]NGP53695.1 aminoacyltransferase [Thioalkalivibrio sp. XN8]
MTTETNSSVLTSEELEWDAFVSRNPLGHHEQTSMYARMRLAYGFSCERVVIHSSGQIVGGAQVLFRRTPIGTFGVLQRGPLAREDDPDVLAAVVERLDEVAQEARAVSLRVQTFCLQANARAALEMDGFIEDESWVGRQTTTVARLGFSDEDLLARMAKQGRYKTRLAKRSGVVVSVGGADTLEEFFALHQMTAEHHGFPIFPRSYYNYIWSLFADGGRVQQFIAVHDGKPVAAILNAIVGDHMLYGWGGTDRSDAASKLAANYLLHYEAMKWARDHGCSLYDMLGISLQQQDGLTRFKTRVAPELKTWPAPIRKWYGPLPGLRANASTFAWSRPIARKVVKRIARQVGLAPKMPW